MTTPGSAPGDDPSRPRDADEARAVTLEILDACAQLGFLAAGVADAGPSREGDRLREWLARGRQGEMDYLAADLPVRLDIRKLLPGAKAVVMVADQYAPRQTPRVDQPPPGVGQVARYARGRDYHRAIKKRLHSVCDSLRDRFPGSRYRTFVDTAPVLERELAVRAGLGWVGKHTLVIRPGVGSFILLGGFATTLPLSPVNERAEPDHCGSCTRCLDACPTGALTPYSIDARRCISYLTVEHRSTIDPELQGAMGQWVFGCDVCQTVCPHNSPRPGEDAATLSRTVNPAYASDRGSLPLPQLLGWTADQRRDALTASPMKRASLEMMRRSAAAAAGNSLRRSDDPDLRAALRLAASPEEPSEVVRATAARALREPRDAP